MNIIRFAIRRKTFISMLFIMLCLLGYVSYKQLPVELFPSADLPFLIVQVTGMREMDPDYMEKQAIIPLEGAISTLEGIDQIESSVNSRNCTITVSYNQNVKIKYAYLRLQEKVNTVKSTLGEEFSVNVVKIDTELLANMFMSLQVRGEGGVDRLRQIADKEIVQEFENIDGIANVEIFGGRAKSVEVILNEEACRAHRITAAQIQSKIASNGSSKTYLGQAYDKNKHYVVNLVADYTDVHDLENIVINRTGPVLLKDIANVYVGSKEEESLSRVNGKEAITVQLVRDTQVNLIELSHTTRSVIDRLNEELAPQGIEIVIQSDTAEDMERNIDLIKELALVGGLLAILILYFFLRHLQLVSVIALAIPISVLTAFNFFYAYGITLNSLTLVGLALAVGMLLDNSVVVLENIYRLVAANKDPETAVVDGTNQVWRSIFASTLSTVTVFLPFIFSNEYIIRTIGLHVGVSIISTLIVSFFVALLLIPVATHWFLTRKKHVNLELLNFNVVSPKNRLIQIYRVLLKSTIRFPARTILGAWIIFFLSVILSFALSLNVSHEAELKDFNLYVTMPSGATLDATDAVTAELEERLADIKEKQDVVSQIYEEEAILNIKLKDDYEKIDGRTIAQVKNEIQNRLNDFYAAEVSFEQPSSSRRFGGGGSGGNQGMRMERMLGIGAQTETIKIKGRDFNMMRNVAEDIRYYLEDLSSMRRVNLNIADNRPEIHLLFDTELMSHYDVPISSITSELAGFQNEFTSGMTYKQGTDEYDIVIRNENLEDKTIDDLKTLRISSQSEGLFELDQLSRIVYSFGLSGINRINQEKEIEVTFQFLDEVNASKSVLEASRAEVDQIIASMQIPAGIAVEIIHEDTSELQEFYFLIAAAFILIYMILASVFESLATPVVMMFTIPLAAIGSFWSLILTGNSLINVNSLIGFLILLGLVVNNGIILIDYTRILRNQGYDRSRALIMAGQARVRPILITSITTIIAMLPLAMGKAEYVTQIGAPFAITVIGGLSLSTLFTLVFIPTFYSGFETALAWLNQLNWKTKAIQILLFAAGSLLIYYNIDSLIWRFITLFTIIVLIPGATYFIMTSLRQARADYIKPTESLRITIKHVVKIYEDSSRFVKEWNKGHVIQEHAGLTKKYTSWRDLDSLVWQIPVIGFLIFFTYFYQRNFFWALVFSIGIYFLTLISWSPVLMYFQNTRDANTRSFWMKLVDLLQPIFFWGFPAINLLIYYLKWENLAIVIFLGVIWYLALAIYTTSNRLHKHKVNIMRLTGRFAGMRRVFYQFVQIIPVIGKKKTPFRALDGVSLEIGSGMFGLLGPNGAGKTTLMRIICGILEQTRGTIWINDIDLKDKREELQGLIGYLPQEFGTYENMTAYEFLNYQAILKNIYDKDEREKRVDYCINSVHLDKNKHQKIGSFSGGMKQRIGIAQTLLHLPRILVVDEPTAGLDPRERIRFRNLLVELSRERIVIFSTHIIEDISSSCNKVAVLNRGKLCYLGEPQEMTRNAEGVVWQFHIATKDFEERQKDLWIVHHMRDGERIRVRCLSGSKPDPEAQEVRPTLEDAYLWLLRKSSC